MTAVKPVTATIGNFRRLFRYNPLVRFGYSVSARARFLRFDPVNSSVDATKISECVFRDATKLPPLKCLKNPVSTQLSVKRAWDISVLKYYTGIIDFFTPDNAILSHLFLEHSASLSVRVTTDAWESKWLTARHESMTNASPRGRDEQKLSQKSS